MATQPIQIYHGDELERTEDSISDYTILNNYTVYAYTGGTADKTVVKSNGLLVVDGGTVTNTTVRLNGTMRVNSGVVDEIELYPNSTLILNSAAEDISMMSGAALSIYSGGSASDVAISINAEVTVANGGLLDDVEQTNGTVMLNGGTATEIEIKAGTFTVGQNSLARDIELETNDAELIVLSGGTLTEVSCDGGTVTVASGATVKDTQLTGYTKVGMEGPESGKYSGTMNLASGAVHRGTLSIAGNGYATLTAQAGSVIDFTLSECTPGTTAIIDNFAGISGSPSFTLTIGTKQTAGTYCLSKNASAFSATITVKNTANDTLGTLSVGETKTFGGGSYTLTKNNSDLMLAVTAEIDMTPKALQGSSDGISWTSTGESFVVQYSTDSYAHALSLQTTDTALDTYSMAEGTWQWRVRYEDTDAEYVSGAAIAANKTTSPTAYDSNNDGVSDLFFANSTGLWEKGYAAQHVGSGDWTGTSEIVRLEGRNKFTDPFTGSEDANLLVLTDDTQGDALFVDDIYSAFPAEQQSRMAQIDEIRAGDGDDIVDMTSQRFACNSDSITLRGGDGNDTLWAGADHTQLFGDDGNDRLVGASGDDLIVGGAGNDSMHGGGGSDLFCFCGNWGNDTIEQLSNGEVTLWFSTPSGTWDASTMTYTSGENTVRISGITNASVTLKYGDDGSEQYDILAANGAFMASTSHRVFENTTDVVIASL